MSALSFIDEFLLCFRAAFVCLPCVPVIKPLPLCFNSMFTSDEIIHNGPAGLLIHQTSAASFSVSDSDFMPAHTQPRLTFKVLAFIQWGGPAKKVSLTSPLDFILVFIVLFCAKLNRRFQI